MKLLLILFCFSALSSNAGDKIDIDSIPWTDACYFWSMEGKRLPVFNKNLMGNKLSIGGVKYARGIAGHTPFSVVYNLSGEAFSFSAIAGIDDEAHPRDPKELKSASVEIQILIDRKTAKCFTVKLGEKGIPIKIDLRDKQQIELRGTYKTGFRKQRVNFANAYFEVKNKKKFLKSAAAWQNKVKAQLLKKVSYPPAPNWEKVKIRKLKYRNWNNAYELSNSKCSLIVVPEYGGRILKFALHNKENILFQGKNPNKNNLHKRGMAINGGGNFSRPQPRNYFGSSDPILAYGQYSITFPAEGEVIMTSAKSYYFGLQYIYRVKLHPECSKVTLTTTHKNIASYPHKAGVWSLTRIPTSGVAAILMPKEMKNPYKKFSLTPASILLKNEKNNRFDKFTVSPEFLAKKRSSLEWQNFPSINEMKVLMKDKTIFTKTFNYQKSMDKYMGQFYPAHFYICKPFIEVETHSPTKTLKSGGIILWNETWTLTNKVK